MRKLKSRSRVLGLVAAAIICSVLNAAPATAQESAGNEELYDRLQAIYEKADPVERLEAYDALVEALFESSGRAVPDREASSSRSGSSVTDRWIVNVDTDPLSDETVVFFAVTASSGGNRYGEAPVLALRHSGSAQDVYIVWHDYLAEERQIIEYRIGEGRTQRRGWPVSTDNEATFYPGDVGEFVRELAEAEGLVARTTPYNESPVTAVFDLSGLEEIVEQHSGHLGDWAE